MKAQHGVGNVEVLERAAPKVKFEATDVRVLYAREILTRFFAVAKD
jgi:hypothetical protein